MIDLVETPDGMAGKPITLALHEEQAVITKRTVPGATVRIATTTSIRDQDIDETLSRETVEVERVPIGRVVETTPEVRQEGDITIIPVMEEILVIERRLILKEEVRIKRIRTTQPHHETVQLRSQTATITRSDADQVPAAAEFSDQIHNSTRETP